MARKACAAPATVSERKAHREATGRTTFREGDALSPVVIRPAQLTSPDTGPDANERKCRGVAVTSVPVLSPTAFQFAISHDRAGTCGVARGVSPMSSIRLSAPVVALAAALPLSSVSVHAQHDADLAPVVVTATRQAQRADDSLASVEVLTRADIERAGQSSLIDVLRALPGVQVSANGGPGSNATSYIRGAESRHTLLLIDGVRVGSASSGAPTLETIPLAMIERIEVLRGPASALYGSEAIGGVIQIFTRKGEEGFHPELFVGYGTHNTFKGSATLAGGVERLRYSLTAGKERTDGYNSKRDPRYWVSSSTRTSYWADDDGLRNDMLSGSLSLGFRSRDEVGVSFAQSDARNWYDASGLIAGGYFDSYIDKKSSMTNVYMRNEVLEGWTSTLRLGQSQDKTLNKASTANPTYFNTLQDQFVWQHDLALPVGTLLAAYEYVESKLDSTTAYRQDSRRVNSAVLGWTAAIDAHHLQINARHDDNSQFGAKTTGLFAYGYDLNAQWRLRGSIATAFNAPTFNQLYWPASSSFTGNPDLKPEEALNREIGVRWSSGAQMVEAVYFDNKVKNLVSTGSPNGLQVNIGEARLKGVELAYFLNVGNFNLAAGADFLSAKDENSGRRLQRRAQRAGFLRLSHTLDSFDWGVEWSGAGRRYDNAANTVELHGYGLLSAFAHYRVARDWRIEARADNILDQDYELARGYRTPGTNVFVGVRYTPR